MTLTALAETLGCSERSVRYRAKALWPFRSFAGGAALTESEAHQLAALLPHRNFVSPATSGKSAGNFAEPSGTTGNFAGNFTGRPSATFLREVRLLFEAGALTADQVASLVAPTSIALIAQGGPHA